MGGETMAIQTLSVKVVATASIIVCASAACAARGNAIGGTVRDAATQKCMGDVHVEVSQDSKIGDDTKPADGAYTLEVPSTRDPIDIIFTKPTYFNAFDPD